MITIAEQYSVEAYLKATGVDQFSKSFKNANDSLKGVEDSGKKVNVSIGTLLKTIAGIAATVGVFRMLTSSLDGAITRFDTLSNFPKVLQLLGFNAESSEKAISRLSDGIDGLPTTLDSVASTTQRIASMTGDLDGAVDTTLALNNAFLASGSSTADASRGLEQYVQMLSRGEVDLQSWRTLQETMPVALNKTAEAFGYTGKSAQNDLYDALQSGETTFDEFNGKLIELNNATGGFAEMAKQSSTGIATSWQNVKTAVVKGLADMLAVIDQSLKKFGGISGVFDSLKSGVQTAFSYINSSLPTVINLFKQTYDSIKSILPIVASVVTSFLVFNTLVGIVAKVKIAVAGLRVAMAALNATMRANPVILVISLIVGLGVALFALWKNSETVRNALTSVFNSIKSVVMPVIQTITDYIMTAWGMLVEWWNTNNQQILTTALNVWNSIVSFITPIIQTVVSFIMEIWTMLTTFWQEHGQMILQAAMNVWTVIQTVITTVVTVIWNIIQVAMTIILTIMQTIWPVVQALIVTTWNAIKNVIQGAINVITGIIQFFSALFTGNWSALWDSIKQILSGAVQAVWGLVNLWFVSKILKLGQLLFNGLKSIVTSIWNTIKSLFTSGVNVARNVVSTGFNFIRNIISTIMNFVRNLISTSWNFIRNIITTVVNGIRNTISSVFNSIRNTISNIVNAIRNTISNIFNSLKGIVSKAFNGVKSAVSNGINGAYKAVTGKISDFFNAGKNIVGSIADGIKGAASKVTDAIGNVTSKIRDFLPFSPAKEGALRDIMKIQIPQSIAESIDNGRRSAVNAMSNLSKAIYGEMPEVSNMNIAGRVANSNARINSRVDHEINNNSESNIERLLNKIANRDTQIVMDTGELVGSTKDKYNESLGDSTKSRRRWSLA